LPISAFFTSTKLPTLAPSPRIAPGLRRAEGERGGVVRAEDERRWPEHALAHSIVPGVAGASIGVRASAAKPYLDEQRAKARAERDYATADVLRQGRAHHPPASPLKTVNPPSPPPPSSAATR